MLTLPTKFLIHYYVIELEMAFEGKILALTGGASGIGLATAHLLASRGATLSLADVNGEALQKAAADIKEKHKADVHTFILDVRKPEQVEAWIKEVVGKYEKLDGAANLAGVIGTYI